MAMSHVAYRSHQGKAADFAEYLAGPSVQPALSITNFEFQTADLAQLAEDAWPFVRGGYLRLVEASRHAREAAHPAAVPRPGIGHGLPIMPFHYRSTLEEEGRIVGVFGSGANARTLISKDGGLSWQPGRSAIASEIMDRCRADGDGRAFSLSLTETGRQVVLSQGPEAPPQASILSEAGETVSSVSCDHSALVAVVTRAPDPAGRRSVRLRICPFRLPCRELPGPSGALFFPVDILRAGGDTIVSRSFGGMTRVTSSRDDGRSWSPWVVAFDALSAGLPARAAPFRLVQAGSRTLLFGRPWQTGDAYALLVSEDHGASFHAP
jgi:hypothetical protein